MDTGIGSPVTSETLMGAATKALTKANIKHTTGQDALDPSFIGTVKLDAANLDIIAAARVMLEGIAKHLEEKRVSPKQGAKDFPERFREEAVQIAADPKIAEFLQRLEVAPKVSKGTLDELKKAEKGAEAAPAEEKKSPPAHKLDAVRVLEKVTGMKPFDAVGGYSYEVRGETAARKLVETLTTRGGALPSGNTGLEESDITLRRRGHSVFVEVKKEAVTEEVVRDISRLPIGPQNMARAAAEIKAAEPPAAGRRF
jgi:hypothetical protein